MRTLIPSTMRKGALIEVVEVGVTSDLVLVSA